MNNPLTLLKLTTLIVTSLLVFPIPVVFAIFIDVLVQHHRKKVWMFIFRNPNSEFLIVLVSLWSKWTYKTYIDNILKTAISEAELKLSELLSKWLEMIKNGK